MAARFKRSAAILLRTLALCKSIQLFVVSALRVFYTDYLQKSSLAKSFSTKDAGSYKPFIEKNEKAVQPVLTALDFSYMSSRQVDVMNIEPAHEP